MFKTLYRRLNPSALVRDVQKAPTDVAAWVRLIDSMNRRGRFPSRIQTLIQAHEILPGGYVVNAFASKIGERAEISLHALATEPEEGAVAAIEEIVKWKTTIQCAHTHDVSKGYFNDAERVMEFQWASFIYPLIEGLNFESVLDLACGHGRNTEHLRRLTKDLHLVDINASCIEACRERFGAEMDGTSFHYYVTDGNHVSMFPDDRLTLVYTWDSMVHFDKLIVRDYVQDIARVLRSGGSAFLHHSNYGTISPDSNWASNPGTRSDMSAQLMREYASLAGLQVVNQSIQGRAEGWGTDELDCVSILRKP